jgi:PAS domain S-box-containing protein
MPEQRQRAVNRLEHLLHVTDVGFGQVRLSQLLNELMLRLRDLLRADTITILLANEKKLKLEAYLGWEPAPGEDVEIPFGRGVVGEIAEADAPVAVPDLKSRSLVSPGLRQAGLQSLLGAPLRVDSRLIGVMHIGSVETREFTAEDIYILALAAERAARAIERTQLYEKERKARVRAQLDRKRLNLALAAARAWSWEFDPNTGLVRRSRKVSELYGTGTGSAQSVSHLLERVHPEDRERVQRELYSMLKSDDEHEFEYRVQRADGRVAWLLTRGRGMRVDSSRRAIGITVDVSNRRMAERALMESERLATAGRLTAVVAHEINNPLDAVTNALYLLHQRLQDRKQDRTLVEVAQKELMRATEIVRQTLGLVREARQPVVVQLREVLDSAATLYSLKAKKKKINLEKRYRGRGEVLGYPAELRQVFSNLLDNAIDASPEGGTIVLSMHDDANARGGWGAVRAAVADQGTGIPSENRQRVFEPFFTSKGETGTGLGLWLSREIMRKHGGSMRFRSRVQPGRSGTCFMVFLPSAEPAERKERRQNRRAG